MEQDKLGSPVMTECRELEPLLAAFVDGEVEADQRSRMQAHLAACVLCRRRVDGERAARQVLHAYRGTLTICAPEHLRRRCADCACGRSGWVARLLSQRRTARTWVPLSFAATAVVALGAVVIFSVTGGVEALAMQLALDHVKCFQFAPAHAEVDPTVSAALWGRHYGWPISVPRSEPVEQLELLDVRRCLSMEGASAHIMYRWRGQPLSVYVLNGTHKAEPGHEALISSVGQEAIIWADAGRTYAVVGRGTHDDLEHIAHYMRTSAR